MAESRLLFIEDDDAGRELGAFNLGQAGYTVDVACSGEEGVEKFSPESHALVITDVRMPGISGLGVLEEIKRRAPQIPVLVITAYGDVDVAVQAMKAGAYDFIGKPFNRDHLLLTVRRALESEQLRAEVRSLRIRASGVERPIVFVSKALAHVLETTDRVAPTSATVLVTGETGTGKELIARRIHVRSDRANGPFVAINCAAMPADLLEAELFGHTRGAFTGATRARRGKFRQADGGTLFLDEIAELPMALQAKLLRVLQERVVDVVGSDESASVDVRVVAATNRELQERVRDGSFREDLLYRLSGFEIPIPALRERAEDIPVLVRHFVSAHSRERDLSIPEDLIAEMQRREWPGNVRQLENACERLAILCRGDSLNIDDLPPEVAERPSMMSTEPWPPLPPEGIGLVDLEKQIIERVVSLKEGNVSQAAAYLRVPRHILAYRMEKYGIPRRGR